MAEGEAGLCLCENGQNPGRAGYAAVGRSEPVAQVPETVTVRLITHALVLC